MINLQFPAHSFKIKSEKGKEIIFDECRKRWVLLTPEEWVRQNFLQHLILQKLYPSSMIAVEREITVGDMKKRFDIVVFRNAEPWMIVECKEMQVKLDDSVIKQILTYNTALQVTYLVITNGTSTFALNLQQGKFEWLQELPDF
jgi:hypothetical protein